MTKMYSPIPSSRQKMKLTERVKQSEEREKQHRSRLDQQRARTGTS